MRVCVPARPSQLTCFVCDSAFPTSTAATAATSADDVLNDSDGDDGVCVDSDGGMNDSDGDIYEEEYGEEDDGSMVKNEAGAASGQGVERTCEWQL